MRRGSQVRVFSVADPSKEVGARRPGWLGIAYRWGSVGIPLLGPGYRLTQGAIIHPVVPDCNARLGWLFLLADCRPCRVRGCISYWFK